MTATSPPPLPHGAWCTRAFSGDTHASLLLPHQLLIARADALQHGIVHLSMVEVSTPDDDDAALLNSSTSPHPRNGVVLLECVVDREPKEHSNGGDCVQLSAWVLERLGLREGGAVALQRVVQESQEGYQSVELSVVSKYPVAVRHTSSSQRPSVAHGDAVSSSPSSTLKCLPESVRDGRIQLEHALQRQLRASGYLASSSSQCMLQEGHLVAAQLLQETYVFRVESARYSLTKASNPNVQVRVQGWSGSESSREAQPASQSQNASTEQRQVREEKDATMTTLPLEDRLWRAGFAGYDAFFHDVLLNIALVVKGTPPTLSAGALKQRQQIGSHGLLLSGVHGVGKSLALQVLQSEVALSRIPVKRIDGMSLLMEAESTKLSSTYEFLAQQVADAFPEFESSGQQTKSNSSRCKGVLLIDDIDVLFQTPSGEASDESDAGEALTPLGSSLLRLLDAISGLSQRISIVGTTFNADVNIPSAGKRAGRFGKIIEIVVPTEAMRSEILARHLSVLPLSRATSTATSPEDQPGSTLPVAREMASRLAALTGGYVAKDLVRICRNSLVQANKAMVKKTQSDESEKSMSLSLTWEDLLAAQQLVKPSQLRELNVASPGAAGGDGDDFKMGKGSAFAGYSTLRKQLADFITWKFSPSAAMNRLGVANASGILLHGPSGCGKSLVVRTLAAHARVNFVSVKSSEIMSKYFGDSEKAVRELFARARAASPCILFFDEFDAIAHKRSFGGGDGNSDGGGDSVYARILSTFLNEMDGVGATHKTSSSSSSSGAKAAGEILVIAATNRVDALDAALVRPGRIDKTIEIGLPTEADKEEILAHYTRKMPLASDVNITSLATRETGNRPFTGADLAAVCKDAALRALRENTDAEKISMHHFDQAWQSRVSNAF